MLHDEAMAALDEATQLKAAGKFEHAKRRLEEALRLECEAAKEAKNESDSEPSLGMLLLGAASMAQLLNKYDEARELVAEGLSGNPTKEVKSELLKLRDELPVRA